jgi:hypothetical protein
MWVLVSRSIGFSAEYKFDQLPYLRPIESIDCPNEWIGKDNANTLVREILFPIGHYRSDRKVCPWLFMDEQLMATTDKVW